MSRSLLVTFACALALSGAVGARANCPPRDHWPVEDWVDDTAATATARAAEIRALEDYAFTLVGKESERKGIRTDGVVVIKGGKLIYEHYARDYTATSTHLSWSVTKSIASALTGIGVHKGLVRLEDSVCRYRSFQNTDICRVTVKDALTFGTGLEWSESYENDLPRASSVGAMLYGEGRRDMVEFVAGHPFRADPGTEFSYSSGDAVLLSGVLVAAMGPALGEAFPHTELFRPIGIRHATLERDAKGVFVGSSYFYAPPREMARFGYLYLNDGCWQGRRLLPEGWVRDSVKPADVYKRARHGSDANEPGGYSWWLNVAVPEAGISKPFPDVPDDSYAAEGHWGQYIIVVPSRDLVVVRTGDDRDTGALDHNQFMKLVLEVAR